MREAIILTALTHVREAKVARRGKNKITRDETAMGLLIVYYYWPLVIYE